MSPTFIRERCMCLYRSQLQVLRSAARKRSESGGFTIIETLVYLGLFAIMFAGIVSTSYLMFESSDRNQTKAMMQEEKNFLVGKITGALSNAQSISASGSTLVVTKYDGTFATIAITGSNVWLNNSSNILNNSNVTISNLVFIHTYNPSNPLNPDSVEAGFKISSKTPQGSTISQTASTTVYLRK